MYLSSDLRIKGWMATWMGGRSDARGWMDELMGACVDRLVGVALRSIPEDGLSVHPSPNPSNHPSIHPIIYRCSHSLGLRNHTFGILGLTIASPRFQFPSHHHHHHHHHHHLFLFRHHHHPSIEFARSAKPIRNESDLRYQQSSV